MFVRFLLPDNFNSRPHVVYKYWKIGIDGFIFFLSCCIVSVFSLVFWKRIVCSVENLHIIAKPLGSDRYTDVFFGFAAPDDTKMTLRSCSAPLNYWNRRERTSSWNTESAFCKEQSFTSSKNYQKFMENEMQ